MTEVVPPALFTDAESACSRCICRMVSLSLEHGNSDAIVLRLCHGWACSPDRVSETTRPDSGSASSAMIWSSGVDCIGIKARTYMGFGVYIMSMDETLSHGRAS